MKNKLLALLFSAFTLSAHAAPSDDAIRALFEGKLGGKVEQINKAPIAGMYEVVVDGQIMYVDEKTNFIFEGSMFEAKTMKNLTNERKFSKLKYDSAIKHVRGNGKNILVTFEDPNCGYCKKLWQELKQVKNVTIYTFMIPILSEDSAEKSKAIWCAADRNKSWSDWMTNNVTPVAATGTKCDANPMLDSNMKLSRNLGISGTPYMYFPATGQVRPGYIPAAEIEKVFANAGS